MNPKKKKFLFLTVSLISLFIFIYLVDYKKPKKLHNFWLRHPQLDQLYTFTKFTDFLDPVWFFYKSRLPTYQLIIDKQELKKIEQSLPPAYSFNFYLQKDYYWAPAEFTYKDKKYPVKVRVRGDLYHHWSGKKKSYRVKFTDDFQDFPELNFIIPEDRSFFAESLANFRADKMGLLHLESWFGTLKINGGNQGVYLIQEHWNKEFLERHQQNDLGALYGEEDLTEGFYWPQLFSGITAWKKYNQVKGQKENYYDLDYLLKLVDKKTPDEEFKEKIFTIFDKDNFLAWQAHSMLSSSYHQDWGHNLRLYFNQEKGNFEFIPFDLETFFDYQKEQELYPFELDYNPLVTKVILIPEFRLARDRLLYDYVRREENFSQDFAYWDKLFKELKLEIFKDRLKAFSNRFFTNQVKKNKEHFKRHFLNIKKLLEENDLQLEILKDAGGLRVKITNQASSPVLIDKLIFCDQEGKEMKTYGVNREIISKREVQPKKENEVYALIKVVPHTEGVLIEVEAEMMEKIDLAKTKVKAINLVSEKEVKEIEFLISNI